MNWGEGGKWRKCHRFFQSETYKEGFGGRGGIGDTGQSSSDPPLGKGRKRHSRDSRTTERPPTKGTKMGPIVFPRPAIRKGRLSKWSVGRKQKEGKSRKNRAFRPVSKTLTEEQQTMGEDHREIKDEAIRLWNLMGSPVYDSPSGPVALLSDEAVTTAKRGRRFTMETGRLGSNNTRRAICDIDRIACRHGGVNAQIERLRGYPIALEIYPRIIRRVRAECGSRRTKRRWGRMLVYFRKMFYTDCNFARG